jgi:hypothetical protein
MWIACHFFEIRNFGAMGPIKASDNRPGENEKL